VDKLRVNVDGVRAMAERWHAHGDKLSASAAPATGQSHQPSALAMDAGHADVAAASAILTGRVRMTAAKAGLADSRYVQTETESAKRLATIAPRIAAT